MEQILLKFGFNYVASNKFVKGDFEAFVWQGFVNITKYTPNKIRIIFTLNISSKDKLEETLRMYFNEPIIFPKKKVI